MVGRYSSEEPCSTLPAACAKCMCTCTRTPVLVYARHEASALGCIQRGDASGCSVSQTCLQDLPTVWHCSAHPVSGVHPGRTLADNYSGGEKVQSSGDS